MRDQNNVINNHLFCELKHGIMLKHTTCLSSVVVVDKEIVSPNSGSNK